MIAIKTAGPERLTFVHQINTVELAISHRGSEIEVKKCHTFRYIGYFSSPYVLCLSRFGRSVVMLSRHDWILIYGFFDFYMTPYCGINPCTYLAVGATAAIFFLDFRGQLFSPHWPDRLSTVGPSRRALPPPSLCEVNGAVARSLSLSLALLHRYNYTRGPSLAL